jgi:hypothetical protein
MTYGVDQCRVCGVPITPLGPTAWMEQDKANRKPPIPEAEWRRMGFLTVPTLAQLRGAPASGCCRACALKLMHRKYRYYVRVMLIVAVAAVVLTTIVVVYTYLAH